MNVLDLPPLLGTALTDRLLLVAPALLVKATLLLVATAAVAYALRRAPAARRHAVWALALAGMVGCLVAAPLPGWAFGVPPLERFPGPPRTAEEGMRTPASMPTHPAPLGEAVDGRTLERSTPAPAGVAAPPATAGPRRAPSFLASTSLLAWGMAVWLTGIVVVALWFASGGASLRRLLRGARPAREEEWAADIGRAARAMRLRRPPKVWLSGDEVVPMTWGVRRPVVLLPASAAGWDADRRYHVLLHELGHVRRRDGLVQVVSGLACALYWCHPGVWRAARALRAERERACDELVLSTGVDPADYARHLVEIARAYRARTYPAAIPMARRSGLEQRVVEILRFDGAVSPDRTPVRVLPLGLLALTLALAAAHPSPREPLLASVPASQPGAVPSVTVEHDEEPLWRGVVRPGSTVEIRSVHGDVHAALSFGQEVEVYAQEALPEGVEVRVRRERGGVELCVVYAGAPRPLDSCEPPQDWTVELHGTLPRVDLDVRVPVGVGLDVMTWKGSVRTATLAGPVFARALQGDVHVETTSWAEGSTAEGDLYAALGELTVGRNTLEFHALHGDVTVLLPPDADTQIEAVAGAGRIESDVPLARRWQDADGKHATGRLRSGAAYVQLLTERGTLRVRLAEGIPSPDPDPDPQPMPDFGPDPAWDPDPDPQPTPDPDPDPDPDPFGPYDPDWPPIEAPPGIPTSFDPSVSVRALPTDPRDMEAWKRLRDGARHAPLHPGDLVRERALWALGRSADGPVVAPLIAALGEEDWRVREAATWALGVAADARAVDGLLAALDDPNGRVRANAAHGLGAIGDRRAVGPLAARVSDRAWQVRYEAVEALGRIGDVRGRPAVRAALEDPHDAVRGAARLADEEL